MPLRAISQPSRCPPYGTQLNSMRAKDLTDLISLAKAQGRAPTPAELGPLNATQKENLGLINQWLALRA